MKSVAAEVAPTGETSVKLSYSSVEQVSSFLSQRRAAFVYSHDGDLPLTSIQVRLIKHANYSHCQDLPLQYAFKTRQLI